MKGSNFLLGLLSITMILITDGCKNSDDGASPTGGSPLSAPNPLLPANNAVEISLSPTLTWETAVNAVSYTLQVSTDSLFGSFFINKNNISSPSQQVNVLSVNTKYFWRVKASNNNGYSEWSSPVRSFTTIKQFACGNQISYGGKIYNTIKIGNQCWLKENLNIGTMVNSTENHSNNGIIEKYCYNNDMQNCETYGGYYQWNEAMQYSSEPGSRGICPQGWHIPTLDEMIELKLSVSKSSNALKASGQGTGNGVGTDISGFSAILSSYRMTDTKFSTYGTCTYFWSSEKDTVLNNNIYMHLFHVDNFIWLNSSSGENGYSIRCLKD